MDEIVLNWLTQAPLAVVVLIVAWQMARQITTREQKRDADNSALDKQRVVAQQAAQEAQDRQLERMMDLQAVQQTIHAKTNEAMMAIADALKGFNVQAEAHFAETTKYLIPVAEDVPVIKAGVQELKAAHSELKESQTVIINRFDVLENMVADTVAKLVAEIAEHDKQAGERARNLATRIEAQFGQLINEIRLARGEPRVIGTAAEDR